MSEIVIRHVEARDAEPLRLMSAQPDMYHHLLQLPYPSQELWQERVKPRPGHRMLVATIDGEVAGHIGISVEQNPRRSHAAEFGLAVSPAFRQRGVASALMKAMIDVCENWLRIERIELSVYADNEAAIALYRKHGFEIEGTARKYALRNGELVDSHFMARMKR